MEHNGHGHEPGSFEWLLGKRLQSYAAAGASPNDVETIKSRGKAMAHALESFRQQRRQLGDSGRFTQQGLREALGELAAAAAGKIRHDNDFSILEKQIRQVEGKLAAPTAVEKEEKLINFWKMMEFRTLCERLGLTLVDPLAGTVRYDTVRADMLYREALERHDVIAQEALEQWPGGSPVSPDLISQGQEQRMMSRDPVLAKEWTELRIFRELWDQTVRDSLQELREFLPADDDPLARQASGQADGDGAS